jgi:hypothetical protein
MRNENQCHNNKIFKRNTTRILSFSYLFLSLTLCLVEQRRREEKRNGIREKIRREKEKSVVFVCKEEKDKKIFMGPHVQFFLVSHFLPI